MYTSHKWLLSCIGFVSSQQELNDLMGVVTNLGDEVTLQAKNYRMLMGKYKQLEESTKMLSQSNKELS